MPLTPFSSKHLSLLLVLLLPLGCSGERQLPRDPAWEVLNKPPAEITNEYVSQWSATANGVDILEGVTVQQGSKVELTVDAELSDTLSPHIVGIIEVRMLPQGTSDSDWETWEFPMRWFIGIDDSNPPRGDVKVDPGVYDARIYFLGMNPYEEIPLLELLAKTTVTVVE